MMSVSSNVLYCSRSSKFRITLSDKSMSIALNGVVLASFKVYLCTDQGNERAKTHYRNGKYLTDTYPGKIKLLGNYKLIGVNVKVLM